MDWEAWAKTFEVISSARDVDAFVALFAPECRFRDPVTPWTSDVRAVSEHTSAIFPDWSQQISSIRGAGNWAVFEWVGTGTFPGPVQGGPGVPVEINGATIVEADSSGRITMWRDYLDTNEAISQIQKGYEGAGDSQAVDAKDMTSQWEGHFDERQ